MIEPTFVYGLCMAVTSPVWVENAGPQPANELRGAAARHWNFLVSRSPCSGRTSIQSDVGSYQGLGGHLGGQLVGSPFLSHVSIRSAGITDLSSHLLLLSTGTCAPGAGRSYTSSFTSTSVYARVLLLILPDYLPVHRQASRRGRNLESDICEFKFRLYLRDCVILDKRFNFTDAQFPHLLNGDYNNAYFLSCCEK